MTGTETIVLRCACGKRLKAPAAAVGKRARCPACGGTVAVTVEVAPRAAIPAVAAPTTHSVRAHVGNSASDDGLGALYELAEQAEAAAPAVERPQCPGCRHGMDHGAVVCTNCGYDCRRGKALATVAITQPGKAARGGKADAKRSRRPIDLMAPQGSFMVGLAMSGAFAVAAGLVWIVVAVLTGRSFSLISILVGAAAGAGMKVGQKGFSSGGGSAAAGVTAAAILLAKLAVIECILAMSRSDRSIADLNGAKLGYYFFSPIGLIIMAVGMGTAFRTANGSVSA